VSARFLQKELPIRLARTLVDFGRVRHLRFSARTRIDTNTPFPRLPQLPYAIGCNQYFRQTVRGVVWYALQVIRLPCFYDFF
jgi:hypothetical protein